MQGPLIDTLARQGVSRRAFLKYCATLASLMALPPDRRACHRRGAGQGPAAVGDLAVVPGMHRLHRIAHALALPHAGKPDLRHDLARLPPHAAWPRPATQAEEARAGRDEGELRASICWSSTARSRPRTGGVYSCIAGTHQSRHAEGSRRRARPPSSRSAPAPPSAASPRPIRIRPARWRSPTSSRTNPSSTFPAARPSRW